MDTYLRVDEVRALLKLVGEAREIIDAGECAQQHVLAGLVRLAGAEVGVYFSVDRLCTPEPLAVKRYADHGWTDGERQRVIDYYRTTSGVDDPVLTSLVRDRRREPLVTARRTELVPTRAWYQSSLHNELHRPACLDDVMVSIRFGAGTAVNALLLKRSANSTPFSVEQRDLLHLFRCESDWALQRASAPAPALPGADTLTPREQETLRLLLTGASEKVIAARLGLSPHTVHDYVKRLYKKLGVSSRAALMAARGFATTRAVG